MSKRLMVVIGAAVVLLLLGLNTAREQADLVRFDRALAPIVAAMAKAAEAAKTDRAAVDTFHQSLPEWERQVKAVKPPASGYRVQLYKDVSGFFKEFGDFVAKDPIKARETKLFEQIHPSMVSFQTTLKNGPETVSDDHDH